MGSFSPSTTSTSFSGRREAPISGPSIRSTRATQTSCSSRPGSSKSPSIERGKLYYRFSHAHITRLSRKRTAIAEVLEKLPDRFETYLKILSHLRGTYLHLMRRLSKGELFHLEREAQQGARSGLIQEGWDSFLDAYANWLNSGSDLDRQKVNSRADELSEIDPTFQFDGI